MRAFVGIGGNVGERQRIEARFRSAVRALGELPNVAVTRVSSLYRSAPVGPVAAQPAFFNTVVELDLLAPVHAGELLAELLRIEAEHERDRARETNQGPRPLDLDLLLVGTMVVDVATPLALTVPHPRIHERAFVLTPLAELAGEDFVLPKIGRSLGECLCDPAVCTQLVQHVAREWAAT